MLLDRQTDRQTELIVLIVIFSLWVNDPWPLVQFFLWLAFSKQSSDEDHHPWSNFMLIKLHQFQTPQQEFNNQW